MRDFFFSPMFSSLQTHLSLVSHRMDAELRSAAVDDSLSLREYYICDTI